MIKDRKKQQNSEVKRVNASEIKRRINRNCNEVPLHFEIQYIDGLSYKSNNQLYDYYGNPISQSSWTVNQKRSNLIYKAIFEKRFNKTEGGKLGVSETEIFQKFTQLTYSLQEIEVLAFREEFEAYLFNSLQLELKEEAQEIDNYVKASVFDQLMLHNSTPRLIFASIKEEERKISEVDEQLRTLFTDLKFRRIDVLEFEKQREPLDRRMEKLRSHQLFLVSNYKRMVETTKYRRRKFLKMCFSYSQSDIADCRTVSLCNFYIDEYCRWFNRLYSVQISETQKLNRKLKRRKGKATQIDHRLELLKPYLNSEFSYQKIADETGIPKSTVVRLIKKLV